MSESRQICTFYVDKFFFGIDVNKIQEVIRYQEMTSIPLTCDVIRGIINMRGQIVTAIDMRKRLLFSELSDEIKPTNIVIQTDDDPVSLLVDSIGDVINIPNDFFEVPPENLNGAIRQVLKEVCQFEKQLLLILDLEQVLQLHEMESN
ncbi:MAG: Chemotaxis protein CheW [Legionella sp.]|uniref:chemotaxis protein CheW n=1 Tax=Legionella sp. TaxID=459 RepID=UPI003D12EDB3